MAERTSADPAGTSTLTVADGRNAALGVNTIVAPTEYHGPLTPG